mmetsp:Transcript_30052/g.66579  ORF Transcript_30052/g.66579 Transcript_30052/m.66579 type:complete len:621 (-) Transcript_30052:556-2418(-)
MTNTQRVALGLWSLLRRPNVHELLTTSQSSQLKWARTTCVTNSRRDGFFRLFASLPPHTVVSMPALSPTMSQGNIVTWHVKVGDEVRPGTVFADVETDKATLAFENQDDGFIAKLLVPNGTKDIPVGTPVAVLVEEKESISAFADFTPGATPNAIPAAKAAPAPPGPAPAPVAAAPGKAYPAHTKLSMPSLSPTMERGNIVSWKVKEGDALRPGDILAEIETDKATLGFENQDEGFLAKILVPAGSRDVSVGTTVALIVEDAETVSAFADYSTSSAAAAPSAAAASVAAPAASAPARPSTPVNSRLGPAARMLLEESGLSASDIQPTGPNGIVTKGDVLAALAAGVKPGASKAAPAAAAAPAAPAAKPSAPAAPAAAAAPKPAAAAAAPPPAGASYVDTPNTQIRKIIASRLLKSKVTIPGLYVSADVGLDSLAELRQGLLAKGVKVSVNDFVLKAVAAALREVPEANVFWDSKAGAASPFTSVDISVAVATDRGLITPIVKNADKKSLQEISKDVKALALKARENKLKPEEFQGGSFTVSNLGMMGVNYFSAIINPPQAAIMAIGTSMQKVVLQGGKPVSQTFMTVTLSADHRVYDGELVSRFLTAFKANMESPVVLLT